MIIISGPSTIGKNPFIFEACKLYHLDFIVPLTSRAIRNEEINGKDYTFLSKEQFKEKIINREVTQWDYCLNNYYGYSFEFPGKGNQITHGLSRMALRIKALYPDSITTIFLQPQSVDRIMKTLDSIYDDQLLLLRKALVNEEMTHSSLFDYSFEINGPSTELLQNETIIELLKIEQKKQI